MSDAISILISIHAPARGATSFSRQDFISQSFQSTLPRGERLYCNVTSALLSEFQSTLPRGERQVASKVTVTVVKFQSTLPRGERPICRGTLPRSQGFQSALPRGERRADLVCDIGCILISIRAPTRGATFEMEIFPSQRDISIRAPTRGATGRQSAELVCPLYFNPRSHEGSDPEVVPELHAIIISIRAPTRGATYQIRNTLWK